MVRRTCLTPAELTAFQLGDLPDNTLEEVAAHLETCADCEAAAQALDNLADTRMVPFRTSARAAPPSRPPRRIGEHEILEEIGRGGMGVVYKARHTRLQRTVALKMLLAGEFGDRGERDRFRTEAEATARLHHPNIVQIYEVGEYPDPNGVPHPYFTLELVDGGSLATRLEGRPLPPAQAAGWLEALARAVHYAHQQGIVHRDLKPSNVLLTREDQPKVCDFGVAKRLSGEGVHTQTGFLVGTAEYMAPEQASGGGAVGAAADIHALGAILYKLLTGRPPFRAASVYDTLSQVREQEPVPPSHLLPQVPRDLETICLKCLQKEPGKRYATAEVLAEDLRHYLAGEPILARPVGPLERAAKWVRRRPAVAGLLACVIGVTVVGLALVTWQWQEALGQKDLADRRANAETEAKKLAQDRQLREQQARHEAEVLTARLTLDQGLNLCARGDVPQGVLVMGRALERAARVQDAELEALTRAQIGLWSQHVLGPPKMLRHPDWVTAAAFHADGKRVATASQDKTVQLWDCATGQPVGAPLKHPHPVWALAFSPDGRFLVTNSGPRFLSRSEVRLWDLASGQCIGSPMPAQAKSHGVQFNSDGSRFLTLEDLQVQLWNTVAQQPVGAPLRHAKVMYAAAFSPDGTTVVTGGIDGSARLWDAATGQARAQALEHGGERLDAVAFSPDGKTVATGASCRRANEQGKLVKTWEVRLWHVADGKPAGPALVQHGPTRTLAFSADGRFVAAGAGPLDAAVQAGNAPYAGGEIRQYRVATGELVGLPISIPWPVECLAYSPDGQLLLTGCRFGPARFFLAATGTPLAGPPELQHDSAVGVVAFSRDGRWALTSTGGFNNPTAAAARLWEIPAGLRVQPLPGHGGSVDVLVVRKDGKRFLSASADGIGQVWDTATLKPSGQALRHQAAIHDAVFSPDGDTVLTGSADRTARLWDAATGEPRQVLTHDGGVTAVTFSADGRLVLTGMSGAARLWDAATGELKAPRLQHLNDVNTVAFTPDGQSFVTAGRLYVKVWRLETPVPVSVQAYQTTNTPFPAGLSPDGSTLVVASGKKIAVYDRATGRPRREWQQTAPVQQVCFCPDGKTVLLVGNDYAAQLWDATTAQPKGPPLLHQGGTLETVAFSPDGRMVLTGGGNQLAQVWDTATAKALGPPLAHRAKVAAVAFDAGGRFVLTGGRDGKVSVWPLAAPAAGTPDQIRLQLETLTGLKLDEQGRVLQNSTKSSSQ